MKTFETEYKSFYQRILNLRNFSFLALFVFYSYLNFNFKLLSHYSIIIEILLSIILITFIISKSKTNIHIISLDENNITLEGETFNKK